MSNWVRERNGVRFQGRRKGKENRASVFLSLSVSWFSVIHVFMRSVHAFNSLVRLITSLRGTDFWSSVSPAKSWWFRVVSYNIGERCGVQDKENGPQYWALRHTVHELWWWRKLVIDWSRLISERYDWNDWSAEDWMPNSVQVKEEKLVVSSVKSCRKIQQKNGNAVVVQSGENIIYSM